MIRFIWESREVMKKKRKCDGVGVQELQGRHWDRGGYRKSENQNSTRFGGGRGRRGVSRDSQNGAGGGGRGGNGLNTTPPIKTDRKLGVAVRTDAEEVGWRRQDNVLIGMGTSVGPAVRCTQEKVGPAIWRPQMGR